MMIIIVIKLLSIREHEQWTRLHNNIRIYIFLMIAVSHHVTWYTVPISTYIKYFYIRVSITEQIISNDDHPLTVIMMIISSTQVFIEYPTLYQMFYAMYFKPFILKKNAKGVFYVFFYLHFAVSISGCMMHAFQFPFLQHLQILSCTSVDEWVLLIIFFPSEFLSPIFSTSLPPKNSFFFLHSSRETCLAFSLSEFIVHKRYTQKCAYSFFLWCYCKPTFSFSIVFTSNLFNIHLKIHTQ